MINLKGSGTLPAITLTPPAVLKDDPVVIRTFSAVVFAALSFASPAHGASPFGIEQLISTLGQPAAWRALGTVTPGVEDGVPHDMYRNSAVIAALLQGQGLKVPFVKLTDDPAAAPSAIGAYAVKVLADKNFKADDQSCGVGVSHLYAIIFAQLLRSQGPQWVTPGISAEEAQATRKRMIEEAKPPQELLAKLCEGWKYRELNQAFGAVLKRVNGEMPYLLGGPLRLNQLADDKRNAAKASEVAQTQQVDQARQRGKAMVEQLRGVSPAITQDPFGACIGIAHDNNLLMKNQCLLTVMQAETSAYMKAFNGYLQGVSADRAQAMKQEQEAQNVADHRQCNAAKQARLAADDGSGPRDDATDPETFARCRYVRLQQRQAALRAQPPLTDEQWATQELARAQGMASRYPQFGSMPANEQKAYLDALKQAARLGNVQAKMYIAQIKAQNLQNQHDLAQAEQLLNEIDKARGPTVETQALRDTITAPLQALRVANSPASKRKAAREALGQGADAGERAALTMDQMSRNGGVCDTLVVQAYNYATNGQLDENVRMMVITQKLLESANGAGCLY